MAINRWRYVRYLDDGVSEFQCLKCYNTWDARSGPGYTHEGQYTAKWLYCPFCATKWDCEATWHENDYRPIDWSKYESHYWEVRYDEEPIMAEDGYQGPTHHNVGWRNTENLRYAAKEAFAWFQEQCRTLRYERRGIFNQIKLTIVLYRISDKCENYRHNITRKPVLIKTFLLEPQDARTYGAGDGDDFSE